MFWLTITAVVAVATWLAANGWSVVHERHVPELEPPAGWSRGLVVLAICCATLGLGLRLPGFGSSLWTDEFGTLWAVESGLGDAIARSYSFHGQAPLYYVIVWLFVQLLGESEAVLRLPSLLAMIAAALVTYRTGKLLGGVWSGVVAGSLLWLAAAGLRLTSEARPYALAVLFTACALHGFLTVTRTGNSKGRVLFVIGGAGLVASHFVLSLLLLGIGIAYAVCWGLRRNYTVREFSSDVLLQVLLSAPWAGQLMGLWGRKGDLDWIQSNDLFSLLRVFRPELLLVVASCVAGIWLERRKLLDSSLQTLAILLVAQPLALCLLGYAGVNVATSRYATNLLVPLCLLSAYCLSRVPLSAQTFGWIGWAYFTLHLLAGYYGAAGNFTQLGRYDWRTAVSDLQKELGTALQSPVLFRSGFIEDDLVLKSGVPPATTWAVLRSPGKRAPAAKLIPLTFNWIVPGRTEYFEHSLKPALVDETAFYFLTCQCWAGPDSEYYADRFADWVERYLPDFKMSEIPTGSGMRLLKFEKQSLASRGAG